MKKYLILLVILSACFNCTFAEAEKDKTLTRAEVIDKISTADFFKKKIGDLLN